MPHSRRQEFVVIDYTHEIVILACIEEKEKEKVVGIGQFIKDEQNHMAEAAFAVRDDYHNMGIGSELLDALVLLGRREGLLGFTAEVLLENKAMLHLFQKRFPDMNKRVEDGVYELIMRFGEPDE
jgi:GNAT superfamily N-acetyltransferase